MKESFDVLGSEYACNIQFTRALVFSASLQGLLLGCIAIVFFRFYSAISRATWLNGDYEAALNYENFLPEDIDMTDRHRFDDYEPPSIVDSLRLGGGEWRYVGQLAASGFLVGLFKVVWTMLFPSHPFHERISGFLKHLQDLRSEDQFLSLGILVASALSIGLGASVGPEAALGGMGCTVGTMLGIRWRVGSIQARKLTSQHPNEEPLRRSDNHNAHSSSSSSSARTTEPEAASSCSSLSWLSYVLPDFSSETEVALCNVDGMAAAFAAIFPSAVLSTLLIHELGNHWGPGGKFAWSETVARSGIAATVCYGLFRTVENRTILRQLALPGRPYDEIPSIEVKHLAYGAMLGIVSGIVGYWGLVCFGLLNSIGKSVSRRLNSIGIDVFGFQDHVLGKLLTPAIGGVVVGLIYVATPLALGDGTEQLDAVFALAPMLGAATVGLTALFKFLAIGISLGFGFVGGPLNTLVFTGSCMGISISLWIPEIPLVIAGPSCLAALLVAFFPAIFFGTVLASMLAGLGGAAASPVFIACVFSYITVSGIGMIQRLSMQWLLPSTPAEPSSAGMAGDVEASGRANIFLQTGNISIEEHQEETLPAISERNVSEEAVVNPVERYLDAESSRSSKKEQPDSVAMVEVGADPEALSTEDRCDVNEEIQSSQRRQSDPGSRDERDTPASNVATEDAGSNREPEESAAHAG